MLTHTNKSAKTKSQAIANHNSSTHGQSEHNIPFIDNRAKTAQLQLLQEKSHASSQEKRIAQFHGLVNLGTEKLATTQMPIQRALNVKVLGQYRNDYRLGEIRMLVHNYNQGLRSKERQEKINELNNIQAALLTWFDQYKDGDLNKNPMAKKMKLLLNEVQNEHEKVVRASVINEDEDPPIANFDELSEGIQKKVKKVWGDLVGGTGNIMITEDQDYKSTEDEEEYTVQHIGFKYEALAAFARLLESEFGRELLIRANQNTDGAKPITIRPGNAMGDEDIPPEEFIAKATDAGKGELIEVKPAELYGNKKKGSKSWKRVNRQLRSFPELVIPKDATTEDKIKLIHDAPKTFKKQGCFKIRDSGGMRYYKFNEGSGAEIVFTRDVRDATDHMTSRFIDKDGNEIIVPVFVTLAHELGHALHFLEGNTVGNVTRSLGGITAPDENVEGNWSNLEEFHTIKGVENSVRKDTGATDRFSHHNYLSYTAQTLRRGPLENAYAAVDQLQNPAKANIEAELGKVNTALGERNLKLAEKLLAKAQRMIQTAQEELATQQEDDSEEEEEAAQGFSLGSYLNFWPFK